MAKKIGDAFVAVQPKVTPGFEKDLEKDLEGPAERSGKRAGTKFGGGMKTGIGSVVKTIGATFLAIGAVDVFKGFISEATESIKVGAQTNAVLKSTHSIAGLTADQIGKLATAISLKTGVDDEAIQANENLLLTFTNLRNGVGRGNDVFNQATQAVSDMSAALGQDGKASAIQLGKALNDPIKGITALSRVGVSFTAQQKKQIAAMVKAHDVLGAQKIILGEVQREFGGSAAAIATPGQKMKVAWSNLQETIGLKLMPILSKLADRITAFLPTVLAVGTAIFNWAYHSTAVQTTIKVLIATVTDLWSILKATIGFIQDHQQVFSTIAVAILAIVAAMTIWNVITKVVAIGQAILNAVMYANPIGLIILAVIALVAAFIYLWTHSEAFRKFWISLWNDIWGFLKAVGAWFAGPFAHFFVVGYNAVVGAAKAAWKWLNSIWTDVWNFFKGIGHWFSVSLPHFFVVAWADIKSAAGATKDWLVTKWNQLISFFTGIPGKIKALGKTMWDGLKDTFVGVVNTIIRGWNAIDFGIHIHLPDWIPVIGGKGFDIDDVVPDIPYMATGGRVWKSGAAIIDEAGAGSELVDLPAGAEVNSAGQTGQIVKLLMRLIAATERIAPGVGAELRGVAAGTLVQARAR